MRGTWMALISIYGGVLAGCGVADAKLTAEEDTTIEIGSASELEDACEELEEAGEEVFEIFQLALKTPLAI